MTLSNNHVFLNSETELKAICAEKLTGAGITYFEYLRVYDDGHCVILGSNHEVVRYVFDEKLQVAAPMLQKDLGSNFDYFILPIGCYEQALQDVKDRFNLAYFMNQVERQVGYFDLYCFGADANNPDVINFYLNKRDQINQFTDYFNDAAKPLLKNAERHKVLLPEIMLPQFKGLSKPDKQELSKRQMECLTLLVKGLRVKEIAKTLNLSPRTIEHYFEAIKEKFNCNTRSDLIASALKMKEHKEAYRGFIMNNNFLFEISNELAHVQHAKSISGAPVDIYWKDKNGLYLDVNDGFMAFADESSINNILGFTDFDLNWENDAPLLRKNDQEVILTGQSKSFFEPCTSYSDKKVRNFISFKAPFHSRTGKILGVFGISYLLDDNMNSACHDLTQRQTECLLNLVRGMTIKQIARKMALSPRTVEHYLEVVKQKLDCVTRAELIAKALQLPFIRCRL